MSYDVKVEDIEYLRHGNTPYLLTLYRPQGTGPFPIMVELHGGAWCRSDRHGDKVIHEALAKSGVIVATLDWRQPPTASYSASFQDIHYGIRWIKSRAAEFGGRPDPGESRRAHPLPRRLLEDRGGDGRGRAGRGAGAR